MCTLGPGHMMNLGLAGCDGVYKKAYLNYYGEAHLIPCC